jgi:hypothetical protein
MHVARGNAVGAREYLLIGAVAAALILFVLAILPRVVIRSLPPTIEATVSDPKDRLSLANDRLKLRNDFRTTCVQVIAGLGLIAGVLVTYRQSVAAQEALALSLETSQKQLEIAEKQSAIAERAAMRTEYDEAVKRLSDPQAAIRLAAVDTLADIAADHEERQVAVAAVLSAFVRERQPWPPEPGSPHPADMDPSSIPYMSHRATDVDQAIFRLGRGMLASTNFVVLSGDLRKADLDEGVFEGSYFSYINFAQSYMANADLRNVTMTEADLSGADLRGAKLCGADLSTATLAEALLDGAVADDSTRWPQPETDYSNYGVVRATDPEECE